MPNKGHHNPIQPPNYSRDNRYQYRSNRSSAFSNHSGNGQFSSETTHHGRVHSPAAAPSPAALQYSAYFINRLDLDNYTEYTLKQTVDGVLSTSKTKGLKVKLSFPDEGLIIDNSIDPNQSWMFKASELLYFWRDPFYTNIIVAVTSNRLRLNVTGPYSASIFRLRGEGSVQMFFQRAQEFFTQLSTPTSINNNSKILVEKSTTVDNFGGNDSEKSQRKKSKHHTMTNRPSTGRAGRSLQSTPVHHGSRKDLDNGRSKNRSRNSIFNLYNNRTNSETTLLNDTRRKNSKGRHKRQDKDGRVTSISVHLSGEHVAELMRELKELRNEIASLKLEARSTPVRSTSTSPMILAPDNKLHASSLSTSLPTLTSQLIIDSDKHTAINPMSQRKPSTEYSATNKRKNEQSNGTLNKRTSSSSSNNTESEKEDPHLVNFCETNECYNGMPSSTVQEDYPSTQLPIRPRPIKTYTNGFPHLNGSTSNTHQRRISVNEEDSSSIVICVPKEKETTKVIPMNVPSALVSMDADPSLTMKSGEIVSFLTSLENTITSPDHTYENLSTSNRVEHNKSTYFDMPVLSESDQEQIKPEIYVNMTTDRDFESIESQRKTSISVQQETRHSTSTSSTKEHSRSQTPELTNTSSSSTTTTTSSTSRSQQVLFANRLTNPVFSVDRQLLANTIANQFDLHLNSPYLQKLIENQHLFVSQKRTYANMIWQMTAEEEHALRSSPVRTAPNIINTTKYNATSVRAKSILKHNKRRSVPRKQRISWDSTIG